MFAKQVERDIAPLSSQLSVGAWQKLHLHEKLELAHYNFDENFYEADLAEVKSRWCAASISQSPSDFGRVALFFVPSVKADALPFLPSLEQVSIKEDCRIQMLRYRASPEISVQDLAREFSSVWGVPNVSRDPLIVDSDGATWDHDGVSVRMTKRPGTLLHSPAGVFVYARRDALPANTCGECEISLLPLLGGKRTLLAERAGRIAVEDPTLTRQIVRRSCPMTSVTPQEDSSVTVDRLRNWFEAAKQLSPRRRAAAFLLADLYVENAPWGYAAKPYVGPAEFYTRLGARYDKEGNYDHNFLERAEKLDGGGEVGELAALLTLSEACSSTDYRPWPDLAIERGESFLAHFSSDQWTPYVHYALARAHSARVVWTYPGGDEESQEENSDDNYIAFPLSHAAKEQEREAAIDHFKAFLDAKPNGPEAPFAWQEAWRLLAGLPPSQISWGCGVE
ncbi:MAG: hypothetical protein ABSD67_15725 [Terracidiphilus sp.]|jgi:hypothetical protein